MQSQVRDGLRLTKPEGCPAEVYAIMARCWLTKPDQRPTFVELRNEIVALAKAHRSTQPMRDIGATLAKAGAETLYVRMYACTYVRP